MLELYNFAESTCSQKVRLCLAEKCLDFIDHRVDYSTREQASLICANSGSSVILREGTRTPEVSDWFARVRARPSFAMTYFPGSRLSARFKVAEWNALLPGDRETLRQLERHGGKGQD